MTEAFKAAAARKALDYVEPGMRLGIGTGSTADQFIKLLGERVRDGLDIIGVPTSEKTAALCAENGIRLTTLEETPVLDLTIDGADEIDPDLRLIKGAGGALLREKIVAMASTRMAIIADDSKLVDELGAFPLPIEVVRFGIGATMRAITKACGRLDLAANLAVRTDTDGDNFITDSGHWIVDASFGRIPDPDALSEILVQIPGVVEHGLFIDVATVAIIGDAQGVRVIKR